MGDLHLRRVDIRDGSTEEKKGGLRGEELAAEIRSPAEDSSERLEMFRSGAAKHRFRGFLLLLRSSSKIDSLSPPSLLKNNKNKNPRVLLSPIAFSATLSLPLSH